MRQIGENSRKKPQRKRKRRDRAWMSKENFVYLKKNEMQMVLEWEKKQGLGKGIVCCFLCHKKQDKLRRTKHSKDDG